MYNIGKSFVWLCPPKSQHAARSMNISRAISTVVQTEWSKNQKNNFDHLRRQNTSGWWWSLKNASTTRPPRCFFTITGKSNGKTHLTSFWVSDWHVTECLFKSSGFGRPPLSWVFFLPRMFWHGGNLNLVFRRTLTCPWKRGSTCQLQTPTTAECWVCKAQVEVRRGTIKVIVHRRFSDACSREPSPCLHPGDHSKLVSLVCLVSLAALSLIRTETNL